MDQIAIALLIWISAHSEYTAAQLQPPPIVLLSPEAMTAVVHEREGLPLVAGMVDKRIQGYFSWDDGAKGTIYLVRSEDTPGAGKYANPSDNPLFRERLLHELVHFAQRSTGAYERRQCSAQNEFDAYQLGGLYLRQLGVPDPLPNRLFLARMYSAC